MDCKKSYIATIDVGSSFVRGCVGYVDENNVPCVLAATTRQVGEEVRRGLVCNAKGTARIVREVIEELQSDAACLCTINEVQVAVNAASMRSKDVVATNGLQGSEEVTESVLEELRFDCESQIPDNRELFFSYLKEYRVDGFKSLSPLGEKPKMLEASYTLIHGKPEIMQELGAALSEAGIDFKPEPGIWAAARLIVPQEDRKLGAVVVNFGAETTTVCVIKDDVIQYMVVLPLGGQSITNDLQRLSLMPEEAEREKLQHGSAIHYTLWRNGLGPQDLASLKELSERDRRINETVVARAEEIVANVWIQIQASGIGLQDATVYMTGGASQLKDLDVLLSNQTHMRVVKAAPGSCQSEGLDAGFASCVGLIAMGKEGGCVPVEVHDDRAVAANEEPAVDEENIVNADTEDDEPSLMDELKGMFSWAKKSAGSESKSSKNPEPSPASKSKKQKPSRASTLKNKGNALMGNLFDTIEEQLNQS